MYNRPYRFEFYDTASPENYTLLRPDFVVLCYDVSERRSLEGLKRKGGWWEQAVKCFLNEREDEVPLMVLGLKRDARREGEGVVLPQEVRFRSILV